MTNYVREKTAAAAATSNVASSASSVTLLAANALRQMATIYNDSTAVLYVKFGTAAAITPASYTVQIPAGGYYELPHPVYHGRIDGIWAAANGAAHVTEMT